MRTLCYLFLLCGIMACNKIEFPDTPIEPNTSDIVVKDTLTVAMLATRAEGAMVGVKGYLVGYCTGTTLSSMTEELPVEANTNFLLADAPTLEEAEVLASVGLNKSNAFHASWNLLQAPERLGKYVLVYGKLQTYFGVKGIRDPKKIELLPTPKPAEQTPTDTPSVPKDTTSTPAVEVLTPQDFLALDINIYATVKGYIVGTIEGTSWKTALLGIPTTSTTNLLLAGTPTETDLTKMVPISLNSKSEERTVLNLKERPGLLGKGLTVSGIVATYFGVNGIKRIVNYRLDSIATPPPVKPDPIHPHIGDSTKNPQPPHRPTISDSTAIMDGRAPLLKRLVFRHTPKRKR